MYGVDIEQALYTATENAELITRAYQRGYYDAMVRDHQLKNAINTIRENGNQIHGQTIFLMSVWLRLLSWLSHRKAEVKNDGRKRP